MCSWTNASLDKLYMGLVPAVGGQYDNMVVCMYRARRDLVEKPYVLLGSVLFIPPLFASLLSTHLGILSMQSVYWMVCIK